MKNRFIVVLTTIGIAAFLFTGCTKLPQAEIDAANAAIENAKTAGAEIYAPDSFIVLQDSLNGVMLSIESGNSKFIKNFKEEKEQLAGLTLFAEQVRKETEEVKEALKLQIMNTIAEVQALIEANNTLILEAPKGKEGTTALIAIKSELSAIELNLGQVSILVDEADYLTADEKAIAAKEKARAINEELTAVIAKYKANTRKR